MFGKRPIPEPEAFETSVALELDDADLLDIDGSDDQTMMFESKSEKRRRPNAMRHRPQPASRVHVPEDLRATNPIPRQAEVYADPPTILVSAKPAPKPRTFARDAGESYPPVAVVSAADASGSLKLRSGSSRWGWVALAVAGTLLLIGGSLRAAPTVQALTQASAPPPAAVDVVAPPPTPAPTASDAKVVKFDDAQGVSIKKAPPPHRAWAPPPAKKAAPVAHAKAEKPAPDASAEEKALEELQLRAASR